MLSDRDYTEVVGHLMLDTVMTARKVIGDSYSIEEITRRLFGLQTWSDARFEKRMEKITREEMARRLKNDYYLMRIAKIVMGKPTLNYAQLRDQIYRERYITLDNNTTNAYIKLLCHPNADFGEHPYPTQRITEQTQCPLSPAMKIIFSETFFKTDFSIPLPIEDQEATFSSAFEIDDIITHFANGVFPPPFTLDYDEIRKACANDTYDGLTGLDRLKAEDWGFRKDRAVLAMIAVFKKTLQMRSNQCKRNRSQSNMESICRILLDAFTTTRFYPVEFDFLFPLLLPSRQKARAYGNMLIVDPYYKKALITLLGHLEKGRWYRAEDLWDVYREICPTPGFNNGNDIFSAALSKPAGFVDGLPESGSMLDQMRSREQQLYRRPLFYGLLYLYALFGCLDIREKDPPLTVMNTDHSLMPYSPFDCLDAVCVSDYGEWALGFVDRKPDHKVVSTQPVADESQMLVTYSGKDLELKQYLGQIGTPTLDSAWEVRAELFADGCTSLDEIEKRISRFKENVTQDPPANWLAFFSSIKEDFALAKVASRGRVLKIENGKRFRQLLSSSRQLSAILARIDDDHYFLSDNDSREFFSIMKSLGLPNPLGGRHV